MHFTNLILLATSAAYAGSTLRRRASDDCRPLVKGIVYDCGTPDDVLEIITATMKPSRPRPGKPLEIRVTGNLREEVTYGTMGYLSGKLEGIELANYEEDLCQVAQDKRLPLQCPLQGQFSFRYNVSVPFFTPSGHYEVTAYAFSQNEQQIFNVMADFTI